MIRYGDKPSNQTALPITSEADEVLEIRRWAQEHNEDWSAYLDIVRYESRYGELSPNLPIQILRHRKKVSIRNGAAPILARLALEQDSNLKFRLARSKYDAYFEVKL